MAESSIIPAEKVTGDDNKDMQGLLKAAVKAVEWTYSLLWQLCPQQRVLAWANGYYNGAIKTRKTTHPAEVTAEEAELERSQQLRKLYETLLAGETSTDARACTALSPEDLTETEWFYLMCVSFSFTPPSGIPGKAYARGKHVWLSDANEVETKIFSRAILAKSAKIQTVVCIPILDGVVELGTTDKVKEDVGFVELIKSFFHDHSKSNLKPALSEHSKSNLKPALSEHSTYQEREVEDEEGDEVEEEMIMSEEIRLDSPDDEDVSIQNLRSDFHIESSHTLDTHMMNLMEEEGGNYSQTVTTLLMSQPTSLFSISDSVSTSSYIQSSFITWRVGINRRVEKTSSTSQWMLQQMIFKVPYLQENTKDKRLPREEQNHVVAERRRREKLNKKFITLRSMVPFVTKMDKVSILGDTIEYVNHLRKRVLELETEMETYYHKQQHNTCERKIISEEVEVSIIENDVLLEMRCEYRDGLLLDILKALKELGIEATAVHTVVNGRDYEAEIRAKVRGKKVNISEVKRTIHQAIILINTNL